MRINQFMLSAILTSISLNVFASQRVIVTLSDNADLEPFQIPPLPVYVGTVES